MALQKKINRDKFKHFLNTTPLGETATYAWLNKGITEADISLNPEEIEEQYIGDTSKTNEVVGYSLTTDIEQRAIEGSPEFEYIFGLYQNKAVLDDAKTDLVNVFTWMNPTLTAYPAEKIPVSVILGSIGGAAGEPLTISYTLKAAGNIVKGTFDPTALTFTADAA